MKKVLFFILVFTSIKSFSQCSGTNSFQIEARHWFWAVNKLGQGTDSTTISKIRALRTAMLAANPVDSTSLVTINNVPNNDIINIYGAYIYGDVGDYLLMGSTDAERRTIYTAAKAIVTPCVVTQVALIDSRKATGYWEGNKNGKAIYSFYHLLLYDIYQPLLIPPLRAYYLGKLLQLFQVLLLYFQLTI